MRMEILLVDNGTVHKPELLGSLVNHHVEIVQYEPGINFPVAGKDLIIASGGGGEGREANDFCGEHRWYEDELDLIEQTKKPFLGICLGLQLLWLAHDGKVERMPDRFEGIKTIRGWSSDLPPRFEQYGFHEWQVTAAPSSMVIDAVSDEQQYGGVVEMAHYRRAKKLGVQFHPEKRVPLNGKPTLTLEELAVRTAA